MAKQCIYCGRPLAKDDARFCNDCGQLQAAPISAASGAAAPSAIKVKLPPKEYARDDLSSDPQETSLPGPVVSSTPAFPSPREQTSSPSSRLPKRPTRLKPEVPAASADKAKPVGTPLAAEVRPSDQALAASADKAKPAGTPLAAEVRPSSAPPASQPTPAEEASTMVLPNWREELALLRKEQEQARGDSSATSEKKRERAAKEPPPLPRRSASKFPPSSDGLQAPSSSRGPNTPLPSSEDERSFESPWQAPNTPQSLNSERPGSHTPLPQSKEKHPTEVSRRELHVKVWEPEKTVRSTPAQEEKLEPGPAPAVEQNPFARAAFDAEEQGIAGEELESVTWQAPRSPFPASRKQPPVREEKHPLVREEIQSPVKEEKHSSVEDEFLPTQEERHQPVREEIRRPAEDERGQQTVTEANEGIEDLPTVPLAVPEVAKQEPSIKIERTSTPAPKKWATPRPGNIEDLPTRPMAASSGVSAAPRLPQSQPSPIAQPQSGATRPKADQAESASPSGAYGLAPVVQTGGQATEMESDPLASRARPVHPTSQPGPTFDPASLPPLPQGPLPVAGNAQLRAEAQGPQGPQPRSAAPFPDAPGQRPPAFEASQSPVSAPANASKPTADASAMKGKKPRKQRHTGRLVVIILLVLVLVGGGTGVALNRNWVIQYFQTPVQNQPYQTYQNSSFGVSLDYTQGWSVNVDQAASAVHFADSSRTGQVNLTLATASGQVSDYLNQQATHLEITGPKTAPTVTIGGASWQVVQGTSVLSGATYTAVLYATQHNGHFYMLEFLAPQSSFTHIDQSDFAHMRSSFKFL